MNFGLRSQCRRFTVRVIFNWQTSKFTRLMAYIVLYLISYVTDIKLYIYLFFVSLLAKGFIVTTVLFWEDTFMSGIMFVVDKCVERLLRVKQVAGKENLSKCCDATMKLTPTVHEKI